jgi:hypothetical protein
MKMKMMVKALTYQWTIAPSQKSLLLALGKEGGLQVQRTRGPSRCYPKWSVPVICLMLSLKQVVLLTNMHARVYAHCVSA